MIRRVVQEICGFAPYEKRVIELIKAGSAKDLKKVKLIYFNTQAYKVTKRRVGTHRRAKIRNNFFQEVVREQRGAKK